MEKICETCGALRPVVYCKADAAYLCLSCDAKVHSSNALFNRHLRTLLCDSCRYHPAYARCVDHRMLICRSCDRSLHGIFSNHQKRVVSSYLGCPSALDFASFWGYEFGELDESAVKDQLFSTSSVQPTVPNFDISRKSRHQTGRSSTKSRVNSSTLVAGAEYEEGSSSQQPEILYKGQEQDNTCFIFEQILDLKRLQLTDVNNNSPVLCGKEQKDLSSLMLNTLKKPDYNPDHSQYYQDLVQQNDWPHQGPKVDCLPLPCSQPEQLPFCSTSANALFGESFWSSKSPLLSSQLWPQNMQDLGVCEDITSNDDFNIPDIDITFCNFEELFGGDKDPIRAFLDDNDASCSSVEKDMPLQKSNNSNARVKEDASFHMDDNKGSYIQAYNFPGNLDSPWMIRTPYSTHSIPRFSVKSIADGKLLPCSTKGESSCHSPDLDDAHSEARENAMMRYKEKKKARMHDKQIRYAPRKTRSDIRKRGNG